jgi:hypothetical protein
MGAWKETHHLHYVLNHFGISWDTSSKFIGLANVREEITLSRDGSSLPALSPSISTTRRKATRYTIQGELAGQRIDINTL